jgi:colicin import membrane protein
MAPEVAMPPVPNMMAQVEDWPTKAQGMIVNDDETNEAAAELLLGIKDLQKKVNETFDPIKKKAHETWRGICDEQAKHLKPLTDAEATLKAKIGAFHVEKQRQIEEARRIHEEEIRRAEKEAREAAEAQLERDIEAAEQVGAAPEEIEAMIAAPLPVAPIYVPPPPVVKAAPKGIAVPMKTVATVTNMLAFVKFVAANPQFLNLLEVDQSGLNKMATAMGTAMQLPGVSVTKEPIVRAGGRRNG